MLGRIIALLMKLGELQRLVCKMDIVSLLEEFADLIRNEEVEVYNEFSLQHELGIFLRAKLTGNKVQFERNTKFFGITGTVKHRNYRSFLHQMNCMSASKKLQYINYLIFANTENYYFSKTIEDIVRDNEKLKLLGQENNGDPHLGMLRPLEQLLEYKQIKPDEIPNFLMPEYKINS